MGRMMASDNRVAPAVRKHPGAWPSTTEVDDVTNDTRLLCGWVEGRICHLPPGHDGDHCTVEGGTTDALEAEVLRLRSEATSVEVAA